MSGLKAVILAGGYATRLWPVTKDRSKVLLPINEEETVIDRLVKQLNETSEVSDIYVSTNERFAGDITSHFDNKGYDNVAVSVESTETEDRKLGVVGALSQLVNREELRGDDLFIIGGDNYMSVHLSELIGSYSGDPALATYDVKSKEKATSYGVVNVEDSYIQEFEEKPDNPSSTLVSTACYLMPSEHVLFDEYLRDDNNPDEPGWYMQWLSEKSDIQAIPFEGDWLDIGTMDDYLQSIRVEMKGDNYISSQSELSDVDLNGNNIVLGESRLSNCSITNTVVFDGGVLENCSAQSTLVDSSTYVSEADLEDAMISTDKF